MYPNGNGADLWGSVQDYEGHKFLRLDSSGLLIAKHGDLDGIDLMPNVLMDTADSNVLSKFNHTLVTLQQKAQYLSQYPLNPGEKRIHQK